MPNYANARLELSEARDAAIAARKEKAANQPTAIAAARRTAEAAEAAAVLRAEAVEAVRLRVRTALAEDKLPDLDDVSAFPASRALKRIMDECDQKLSVLEGHGVEYDASGIPYLTGVSDRVQGTPTSVKMPGTEPAPDKVTMAVKAMVTFVVEVEKGDLVENSGRLKESVLRGLLDNLWRSALLPDVWKSILRVFQTKEELREETALRRREEKELRRLEASKKAGGSTVPGVLSERRPKKKKK